MFRCSPLDKQLFQLTNHIGRCDPASYQQCQTLPRELIQDR
jgi:hypothetical protein